MVLLSMGAELSGSSSPQLAHLLTKNVRKRSSQCLPSPSRSPSCSSNSRYSLLRVLDGYRTSRCPMISLQVVRLRLRNPARNIRGVTSNNYSDNKDMDLSAEHGQSSCLPIKDAFAFINEFLSRKFTLVTFK